MRRDLFCAIGIGRSSEVDQPLPTCLFHSGLNS
jgi:hypothetical protein